MEVNNKRFSLPLSLERIEQEELLDQGHGSLQDVLENLSEMQQINDFLGGTRALTRHLYPRLLRHVGPITLLDLGAGGAGLPRQLLSWARRNRRELRVLAVDRSGRNLTASPAFTGIDRIQADALDLPLPARSVDFVISSLFLHHLRPQEVQAMLHKAFQIARRGVVMSDLVRGWLPLASFRVIQPFFARNYLTRHDGALSVRRAYTPPELVGLAERAGLPEARVHAHFPWRMTLVVDR